MTEAPFSDRARIDARDKVRGRNAYAADVALPGLLYAMMVPSAVAKGTMTSLATDAAMRVAGVVRILTPTDFPIQPAPVAYPGVGAPPTLETRIAYRGQPIALVVAETLEAAIEGAEAVVPTYTSENFAPLIDSPGAAKEPGRKLTYGDAAKAMDAAAATLDAEYDTPKQHHNPIELISTTAVWSGGRLTIYEGTQSSGGIRAAMARALGLDPKQVEVKSPSVGGAFGQKGAIQRQTAIVARAAMLIGRPVKLVMPRGQIFHVATFRPHSRHHVRLGAGVDGRIVAARYDAEHQQSRFGTFPSRLSPESDGPVWHRKLRRLHRQHPHRHPAPRADARAARASSLLRVRKRCR